MPSKETPAKTRRVPSDEQHSKSERSSSKPRKTKHGETTHDKSGNRTNPEEKRSNSRAAQERSNSSMSVKSSSTTGETRQMSRQTSDDRTASRQSSASGTRTVSRQRSDDRTASRQSSASGARTVSRQTSYSGSTFTACSDDSEERREKRREKREIRNLSKVVERKLTDYINNQMREASFSINGMPSTRKMLVYDVEYRLKEAEKDRKAARKKQKENNEEKQKSDKRINPKREDNSRQGVLPSEVERLSSTANEIFDALPVADLATIHRYRPHSASTPNTPQTGRVHNYSRHVGAALHSKCYVDYYIEQGLHTGNPEESDRLQALTQKKNDDENSNNEETTKKDSTKANSKKKKKSNDKNSTERPSKPQESQGRYQGGPGILRQLTSDSDASGSQRRGSDTPRGRGQRDSDASGSQRRGSDSSRGRGQRDSDANGSQRRGSDSSRGRGQPDSDTRGSQRRGSDSSRGRGQRDSDYSDDDSDGGEDASSTSGREEVEAANQRASSSPAPSDVMERASNYSYSNDFEPDGENQGGKRRDGDTTSIQTYVSVETILSRSEFA